MRCNQMKDIQVGNATIGKGRQLVLISGPCVIESEEHTLECARQLKAICQVLHLPLIFKASYDKANRSAYSSFRGPGIVRGLEILQRVKEELDLPVLSDVHTIEEIAPAAEVLDILQIPAFLCRQTDLIQAAAKTGKPLHIKKGQFMAPWDMRHALEKAKAAGNDKVILCDRGATFGYNNLVSDMRSLQIMAEMGQPVSFDASHSVQLPGAGDGVTAGERKFIPLLARAAVASGIQVLFLETHPDPATAKSDAASVYPMDKVGALLHTLLQLHAIVAKG